VWWRNPVKDAAGSNAALSRPSSFYSARLWRLGLRAARWLPDSISKRAVFGLAWMYCRIVWHRRKVVAQNLLPVLGGDQAAAEQTARKLFGEFALKLNDLWRYEAGAPVSRWQAAWDGWEILAAAQARGRGVLLITLHLGNWELGGAFLAQQGLDLVVLTQSEPEPQLTALRQASRARRRIKTFVVGEDPFAFVEIIKRLQGGGTLAMLLDRPAPATAVPVQFFGRAFAASVAPAELARASGCALIPVYVVRESAGYAAKVLPEIHYDRADLGSRPTRMRLTQEIVTAFEPIIRRYLTQWYHFVPIWPEEIHGAQQR
jgi:KDO2-lipid IV(A) lauroyltransferase